MYGEMDDSQWHWLKEWCPGANSSGTARCLWAGISGFWDKFWGVPSLLPSEFGVLHPNFSLWGHPVLRFWWVDPTSQEPRFSLGVSQPTSTFISLASWRFIIIMVNRYLQPCQPASCIFWLYMSLSCSSFLLVIIQNELFICSFIHSTFIESFLC